MNNEAIILCSNIITAAAYFLLSVQLVGFVRSSQNLLGDLKSNKDGKKPNVFFMVKLMAALFSLFIILCGNTHALAALRIVFHNDKTVMITQTTMMVLCTIVSISTALISFQVFPVILHCLKNFELNEEGNLQHVENYLVEVVELVKESVIVLADDLTVVRNNDASKTLFGCASLVGERITQRVHRDDLTVFNEAVQLALGGLSQCPVTVEYRIERSAHPQQLPVSPPCGLQPKSLFTTSLSGANMSKIYVNDDEALAVFTSNRLRGTPRDSQSIISGTSVETECVWVESTICKGMRLNQHDDFEYDLKMVTRNIDDRKKLAASEYQNIMRESEEQAHINAAKLRYISCIAHDLKTPLQSFCYTMDLLVQTALTAEQREFVEQATVAVDLMKLTISQTMDISKALTGAKLMPRRTTVNLSSIVERVKVIINGYGKQVPVSFEVAKDVCDTIITDEEWLWQMMLNLLTNACKYTDRGEIRVCIRTAAATSAGAGEVQPLLVQEPSDGAAGVAVLFEVIDTGVGVRENKIATLFDAFSQVQTGQVTGTGLGLFGVRTRAEGLGGSCGARSNTQSSTGTGTVIWFALPYVPDGPIDVHYQLKGHTKQRGRSGDCEESPAGSLTTSSKAPTVSSADQPTVANASELARHTEEYIRSHQLTAMVVDDTLTVRKLMERVLLKMGFARVECYENGSKGLEAMMAQQVDIVFSDVQMPIMTGPEMVARFRAFETAALLSGQRTERQLVVAVTANGSQAGVSGSGGFDEICPKPLSTNNIYQIIHKCL